MGEDLEGRDRAVAPFTVPPCVREALKYRGSGGDPRQVLSRIQREADQSLSNGGLMGEDLQAVDRRRLEGTTNKSWRDVLDLFKLGEEALSRQVRVVPKYRSVCDDGEDASLLKGMEVLLS